MRGGGGNKNTHTHENMQPVSQDVCFKMDPGTSQPLSLLLLCWLCPLQQHAHTHMHRHRHTRTHAHRHAHTHMHQCIYAGLIYIERNHNRSVWINPRAVRQAVSWSSTPVQACSLSFNSPQALFNHDSQHSSCRVSGPYVAHSSHPGDGFSTQKTHLAHFWHPLPSPRLFSL